VSTALATPLTTIPHKSPGRPRSDSVRRAILNATLQLLDKVGYAKLTVEGVAAMAQAGKATIYRWWSSKPRLVCEALMEETDPDLPMTDTGSVREDFRRQMQNVAQLFNSAKGKRIAMIIGVAQEEPEVLDSFRSQFLMARRSEAQQILQRGIRRGELRGEVFSDVALDALYGPLFYRLMVEQGSISHEYVEALCDVVMGGLLRDTTPRPTTEVPN
jgi:AcrR family transcriptional regulator